MPSPPGSLDIHGGASAAVAPVNKEDKLVSKYSARYACLADHSKLVELLGHAATEQGEAGLFDPKHAFEHIASKLAKGVCFVLEHDGEVVGACTTNPLDLGHRIANAIEVTHTYVRPDKRAYNAVTALFDALEAHADRYWMHIFWHELNFPAALRGEPSESARLEKLYKFRRYEPIGISHARDPDTSADPRPGYRHVGRSFLYRPGTGRNNACILSSVRHPIDHQRRAQ